MTKLYYISTNEENRICLLTAEKQSEEQILFEFPEDFDICSILNYKIVNGVLVYDKLVFPESPQIEPTTDEIMNALLGVE